MLFRSLTFGGHYRAPGDVVFGGTGTFRVGELDGRITERVLALRDALCAVQEVEVTANIAGYLWAKLALGAIYFATALVSADVTEQYDQPAYRDMFGTLAGEVMAVAHGRVLFGCERISAGPCSAGPRRGAAGLRGRFR